MTGSPQPPGNMDKEKRSYWIGFFLLVFPLAAPALLYPGSTVIFRVTQSFFELLFVFYILFYYTRHHPRVMVSRSAFLLFLAWAAWAVLATVFSDRMPVAMVRQWEIFCKCFFCFCLWFFLNQRDNRAGQVHALVVGGFCLICFALAVFWFAVPDPAHYDWFNNPPHFSHIRHFGYYCTAGFILGFYFFFKENQTPAVWLAVLIYFIVCWAFLFWSGGRGAVLTCVIGSGLLLFHARGRRLPILFILFFSALAGFYLSSHFNVEHASLGGVKSVERTSKSFWSTRDILWAEAVKQVKDSLMFGLGPDAFRYFIRFRPSLSQPHNSLVQFILEWGIPGTLFFLAFYLNLVWIGVRNIFSGSQGEAQGLRAVSAILVVSYLAFSLIDGLFYHALPLTLTSFGVAVMLLRFDSDPDSDKTQRYVALPLSAVRAGALLLAGVLVLHASVYFYADGNTVPQPDSFQAKMVRCFPSSTRGLENWIDHWGEDHPEAAIETALIFARTSVNSAVFRERAAILYARQGEIENAKIQAQMAVSETRSRDRYKRTRRLQQAGIPFEPASE